MFYNVCFKYFLANPIGDTWSYPIKVSFPGIYIIPEVRSDLHSLLSSYCFKPCSGVKSCKPG